MPTYTILQRYLYRGNKTWYGRINDGGKISYLSLKTKRKTDAQAWLDQRNAARHSQITTTLTVYAHLKQEDMQKAINAIK